MFFLSFGSVVVLCWIGVGDGELCLGVMMMYWDVE